MKNQTRRMTRTKGRTGVGSTLAFVLGVALAGCSTKAPQTSSSSHWVKCEAFADCAGVAGARACETGYCVDTQGRRVEAHDAATPGVSWRGAPCEECDLATQVAPLADAASEDCGRIPLDAGSAEAADCAHAALQAGRSFTLLVDEAGTDSVVGTAWVFATGTLYRVTYDSNVCGGRASCESAGCGPRVVSWTCINPVQSSVKTDAFDCADLANSQALCEPAS